MMEQDSVEPYLTSLVIGTNVNRVFKGINGIVL